MACRAVARKFGVSVASLVRYGQPDRLGKGLFPDKLGTKAKPLLSGPLGEEVRKRLAAKED